MQRSSFRGRVQAPALLPASRIGRLAILLVASLGACTPYAVATTARPLAVGESRRSVMYYVVPQGLQLDSSSVSWPGFDGEWRFGVDDHADAGIRLNATSGVIATYKRRLDGPSAKPGRATALMAGAGFVNLGQHAHVELTLITSGREDASRVPYAGLRVLQIAPLSTDAVHDTPTIGGFAGMRFGAGRMALSLELGAFHDRSALGMRRGEFVLVPSISLHRNR